MNTIYTYGSIIGIFLFFVAVTWCRYRRTGYLLNAPKRPPESHVFLDLETLGLPPVAPVVVIAAYVVDAAGKRIKKAVWRITPADALKFADPLPSTQEWWRDQSEEAQFEAFTKGPRIGLDQALAQLTYLIENLPEGDVYVWGNGPQFDCTILRSAYVLVGRDCPWAHWQEMDCRTAAYIGKRTGYDAKKTLAFLGEPHVALDDARHQARYTTRIIRWLEDK